MTYRAYHSDTLRAISLDHADPTGLRFQKLADVQPLAERDTLAEIEEFAWAAIGRDHLLAVYLVDSEDRLLKLLRSDEYAREVNYHYETTTRSIVFLLYCLISFVATIDLDLWWLGLLVIFGWCGLHAFVVWTKWHTELETSFIGLILLILLFFCMAAFQHGRPEVGGSQTRTSAATG
jgi:hypothetical protein